MEKQQFSNLNSTIIDEEKKVILDQTCNEYFGRKNSPGGVVGIFMNGELVYKYINGYADIHNKIKIDEDSLFNLAHVSKHITAMAIKYLYQTEALNLGDHIEKYLNEFKDDTLQEKITIENLLNMEDGIYDYKSDKNSNLRTMTLEDVALNSAKKYLLKESLYDNNDSDSAFVLLALIVKRVSQKSFGEFLKETFFHPLGMNNAKIMDNGIFEYTKGYSQKDEEYLDKNGEWEITLNPTPFLAGDGNIYFSFKDMCLWEKYLNKNNILKKEIYDMCLDETNINNEKSSYPFKHGWHLLKTNKVIGTEHNGACDGSSTHFSRYLNGMSMFYFSNITNLESDPGISLEYDLKQILKTEDYLYDPEDGLKWECGHEASIEVDASDEEAN